MEGMHIGTVDIYHIHFAKKLLPKMPVFAISVNWLGFY